jgi:hypothetical protein
MLDDLRALVTQRFDTVATYVREQFRTRPRVVLAAAAGTVLVLVGFVSCAARDPAPTAAPVQVVPPPVFNSPAPPPPSRSAVPVKVSDGCQGFLTAAQVSKATGSTLAPAPADGAGEAGAYAEAARAQGLRADVRLCPFSGTGGDKVSVMAMTFPDAGQAGRMFATGQAAGQPLPGVGDAAVTDGSRTLLARRGRGVVLVYLARAANPNGNNTEAMRAVAVAALARL